MERKRRFVADDTHALRGAAKIEYVGEFALDAAKSPYGRRRRLSFRPLTTIPATLPASEVKAAPQADVASIDSMAASMSIDSTLNKGLKGFK